jgi:hypothetical protein
LSVAACAAPPSEGPVADYYLLRNNSYVDFEVRKGLFHIQAYGRRLPFSASMATARENWAKQAKRLCASGQYDELLIREHYVTHNVSWIQPHKDGYALCSPSTLSQADALVLIRESRQ